MSNFLYEITALSFEKFMLINHWKRDYKFKNKKLMVFVSPKGKKIAIPASETYEDFYDSLKRILMTLEMYFDKKVEDIIKEILTSYFDRMEFRIKSDLAANGKLPLGYAADCIDGLRELVLYSSCAEQSAKPICLRTTNSSREIMNKFNLAQTEVGSFIINIDTEIVENGQEDYVLDGMEIPATIEHKVVQRIFTAINQVDKIVQNEEDINNIIENAYVTGITANMCDALMKLKTDDVQIDATVRYASAMTGKPNIVDKVSLKDQHFYVIKEISKRYKEVTKYEDVSIHGYVEKMKKDGNSKNRFQAISMITIIEGRARKIQIELTDAEYKIANSAHMNDREIEVTGELDMSSPKKWVLNGARNIRLL